MNGDVELRPIPSGLKRIPMFDREGRLVDETMRHINRRFVGQIERDARALIGQGRDPADLCLQSRMVDGVATVKVI